MLTFDLEYDFGPDYVFGTIYSGIDCSDDGGDGDTTAVYQAFLSDYWGDGWNYGSIRLTQGNQHWIVGEDFTDGYEYHSPISISFTLGVEVVVSV